MPYTHRARDRCRSTRSWAVRRAGSGLWSRAGLVGCTASLLLVLLPDIVDQLVQLLGRDEMVEVVIDLYRRRPRTRAHAFHLLEREEAVRRDFLVSYAEFLTGVLVQLIAIPQQTTDIGADLDVIFAHRLAMQHRVVGQHFIDLQRGHAHAPGDLVDQL